MTTKFFITSTGTDIGKTFFTCALTHQLRMQKHSVEVYKPIISGFSDDEESSDVHQLCKAQGLGTTVENLQKISPIRFKAPLSPDMAASKERQTLTLSDAINATPEKNRSDYVFIEGVGGVAVPLNNTHLISDWIKASKIPTILVCGSYLGTLSHTITAYKHLTMKQISVHCVIMSESPNNEIPMHQTQASLQHHINCPIHIIKRVKKSNALVGEIWQSAKDITHTIKT